MRVLFVAMSLIWSATMLQAQSMSSETGQGTAPAIFVLQDGEIPGVQSRGLDDRRKAGERQDSGDVPLR